MALRRPLIVALAAALALPGADAAAAPFDVLLVSRAGLAGPGSNSGSFQPSVSDDGRMVTFASTGTNLGVPPGEALLKDMATGAIQNLARESGAAGEVRGAFHARVSDNGQWACFIGNGFAGTSGNVAVVREVGGAQRTRIAGPAVPFFQVVAAEEGDPYGPHCDVSDDGTRVVYPTRQSHDPADADGGVADVYVHDLSTGAHTLVSRADGAAGADADDYAVTPSMTPDGRIVVFRSRANNLSAEDDDGVANVYLRDLAAGRTEWISRGDGPSGGPGTRQPAGSRFELSGATDASVSDDGRLVAFSTSMSGLDPTVPNPRGNPTAGISQVAVRDRGTQTTRVVSRAHLPDGTVLVSNDFSDDPTISSDGRYVAFTSAGSDLDPRITDPNTHTDVFVHDRVDGRTALVSRAPGVMGAVGDDFAYYPYLAGDGRHVAFQSNATNLSDADADEVPPTPPVEAPDVFLRELAPGRPLAADVPGRIGVAPSALGTPPAAPTELEPLPARHQPRISAAGRAARAGAAAAPLRRLRGVRIRLSEYGRLTVLVERASAGRRVGRRCRAPGRRNAGRPRCTRWVAVAGRAVAGYEGVNAFAASDLFGRLRLRPGSYRLTAEAVDFGRLERTRSRAFRVRSARRR